jgi:hypothetical protein
LFLGGPGSGYGFSLKASFFAADRHGVAAVSDDDGMLLCDTGWSALFNSTEQSDQGQNCQHDFNYFVHWGSLRGWILVRRKYMHRFMDLHL